MEISIKMPPEVVKYNSDYELYEFHHMPGLKHLQ